MSLRAARLLAACGAASAALLLCAAQRGERQSTVSPDGRWRAVVEQPRPSDADTGEDLPSTLWVEPANGGARRVLLRGGPVQQDPKRSVRSFSDPLWSLDGGFIYVVADAWATSGAVHQVDVRSGRERFVIDGGVMGVLRNGPYRGMLLVGRHKYWPATRMGSYDPVDLVRPDGKVILTVPGSEADEGDPSVARWLEAHGWRAN